MQEKIIEAFKKDKSFAKNILIHRVEKSRQPIYKELPDELDPALKDLLFRKGINRIYSHQLESFEAVREGNNVVISTGVASGKSLCYQLPILQELQADSNIRALFLFPTKALAQDQKENLLKFLTDINYRGNKAGVGIYDGDTPSGQRKQIREKANFVFSNPDMLHLGILPHHTKWVKFFSNLKYIVIDEVHIYRGIFGSHFTNVLRRLKRIARYYGSLPKFILTSATLSNVSAFIERLIEEEVFLIDHDDSPQGEKHFMIYNPPYVYRELGIRRKAILETIRIANKIYEYEGQTLIFAQSRRLVELILTYLQKDKKEPEKIHGYRSGYLPKVRRKIEKQFRDGEIKTTVTTNALELGIDIGGLDTVIINGYPGSIASTKQQSGRAGRKGKASLTILVASSNLIDQYLVQHPEYIFDNSPEEALINPDNPFILLHHLKCALFEMPFLNTEDFGRLPARKVGKYLSLLQDYGVLHKSENKFFWRADSYPANDISLRTAGANEYVLRAEDKIIGTVDQNSAFWLTHPEAIYIHGGDSYYVEKLDQKKFIVELIPKDTDYYTLSQSRTEFELLGLKSSSEFPEGKKYYGRIKVREQVVGYKKIKWYTNEILGYGNLDLPPSELVTYGYWFSISDDVVKKLEEIGAWSNKLNDYGPDWLEISKKVRERDSYSCQSCGLFEGEKAYDVHHKIPFRAFSSNEEVNKLENLVTLCSSCHRAAERELYIQSGLAGLAYLLRNIAPLFLMCDRNDIRAHMEVNSTLAAGNPAITFYDSVPGGIGLCEKLYDIHTKILDEAFKVVSNCLCKDGCPACVGPVAEKGVGAKAHVKQILKLLCNKENEK